MKPIHTLLALGMCVAVTTSPLPASAAKKAVAVPTLKVSKKGVSAACRGVSSSRDFENSRRKAVERKALSRKQTGEIATEVCRFFAASAKQQSRYWNASLAMLVKQGKLTTSDQALLSKVLTSPEVLVTWKPTTEFGKLVLSSARQYRHDADGDDATTQQSNSGAGAVLGGIIGGIAGGMMTGGNPAGIGAGIAVGMAAGNLAETATSSGNSGGVPQGNGDGDEDSSEGESDGAGDGAGQE